MTILQNIKNHNKNIPKGLQYAVVPFGKSIVEPLPKTSMPGINFKLSGFGVSWV